MNSSFNIFAVFTKYEKSRDENGQEKESGCSSHTGGVGPPLAAPPWCEDTSELISIPVSSCDFASMYNFHLYNPPESLRSIYRFLVVFCFELFLLGVDHKVKSAMASSSNDKGKRPREDDHQDPKLKKEKDARRSRARNPTFEGPTKARHIFSHNMQGPILHVLDLNSMPMIKEGMLVTDKFCAQYRSLEKEVEILKKRISGFAGCWNISSIQG
jgi:hypothetical protein